MLLALGIAGIVLGLAGTGLAMWGQSQQNKADEEKARLEAQQLRDTQNIYDQQARNAQKDIQATQTVAAIQGSQLAFQAGAAKGSSVARSAVGGLGGESVLRRASVIQRQYLQQSEMNQIQTESRVRAGELAVNTAEMQSLHAGQNAEMKTDEANWLRDYGWMSVTAIGLQGVGNALTSVAKLPMGGGGLPSSSPSNPFGVGYSTYDSRPWEMQ